MGFYHGIRYDNDKGKEMSELLALFITVPSFIITMAVFVYCMFHYPLQPKGKLCLACGTDTAFHNSCMKKACIREVRR